MAERVVYKPIWLMVVFNAALFVASLEASLIPSLYLLQPGNRVYLNVDVPPVDEITHRDCVRV